MLNKNMDEMTSLKKRKKHPIVRPNSYKDLPTFYSMWTNKEEYEDVDPGIVH